ncbi:MULTISPECIES: apolipoprotein N-acyltransferase [Actinomadura]|uniref:Apolipoprotein N-acyltransferase n=1 Tax=Actinomadura yumaensis TaxID=111807 RepID=A0ABW2CSJ6_9ACTN|nr:apolipoprotein N-acyltransferase [Actinomadura sp. J1-007]MWK37579.1 apolipoprotein N-acyltransferase [Actinomadura sp. J1-007]
MRAIEREGRRVLDSAREGRRRRAERRAAGSRWSTLRWRLACLPAGAAPILTFPRADLGWLAWVVLVPGMLLIRSATSVREAAIRGWWFGAGYLLAALYWTVPNIGPGLPLIALVFGAMWAGWAAAVRWLVPARPLAALLVVPSVWLVIELVRSWPRLGGPWALIGASQWRHPAVLGLAAVGGVWLVSFAIVAANTAIAVAVLSRAGRVRAVALACAAACAAAGPLAYAARDDPAAVRELRVALVQPGVVDGPEARLAAGERITAALPPADLVVWGESSVGYDLRRRDDVAARLTALAARSDVLVNEDARDAGERISKSTVLIGRNGPGARYVKTRLVPFGEYIPFRSRLGWLSRISGAAGEDRVPGTGAETMRAGGVTIGPLICFESAFPDLGRAAVRRGARVLVYQSSTSTFQKSWAPPQHASLAALRAAETGRPAVQAALTGVSAAFDARGRRLAWTDTDQRGSTLVTLPVPADASRTPYDRFGDYTAYLAVLTTVGAAAAAVRISASRRRPRPVRWSSESDERCAPRGRAFGEQGSHGGASGADDAE